MATWKDAAFAGNKILAIKLIREKNTLWSLKEAKFFIEGFINGASHAIRKSL